MKLRKNIAISEAGLVFNPVSGESFAVNPIGIEILNLLREGHTPEEIGKVILAGYTTDKDTFEKDFQDFTGILTQLNLLEHGAETKA